MGRASKGTYRIAHIQKRRDQKGATIYPSGYYVIQKQGWFRWKRYGKIAYVTRQAAELALTRLMGYNPGTAIGVPIDYSGEDH